MKPIRMTELLEATLKNLVATYDEAIQAGPAGLPTDEINKRFISASRAVVEAMRV